jgi:hypothetical protein
MGPPVIEVGYVGTLNAHSLGDTLSMFSYDARARRSGRALYWDLHFPGGPVHDVLDRGWLHLSLFDLYRRAALFTRLIVLPGVAADDPRRDRFRSLYAERVLGEEVREWRPFDPGALGFAAVVAYDPTDLRARFAFLGRDGPGYATIHPASTHYALPGTAKRISLPAALGHLARSPERRVLVLGSRSDAPWCALYAERLRAAGYRAEDRSGATTIEDFFALLYNSRFHVCCDSCSAFFTGQLGIPTAQVYMKAIPSGLANFAPYYAAVPALRMALDPLDTLAGEDGLVPPA